MKRAVCLSAVLGMSFFAGCNQPTLIPNTDPNLRRTSTQFAADAAKRHPYKADAPQGGEALANAQYDLTFSTISLLNYSTEDWTDVEVWVNRKYVCWLPLIEKGKVRVKTINFSMLYDADGNSFSTDGGKNPVQAVEILRSGKMYAVSTKLAD